MPSFVLPTGKASSIIKWLLIFAGFALAQVYLVCGRCLLEDWNRAMHNFLYAYALFFFLWMGNAFLGNFLGRFGSWVEHPGKRFVYSLLSSATYSALMILAINWVYSVLIKGHDLSVLASPNLRLTMTIQLLVTFFITMTVHAVAFLRGWRETAVSAERFKKEHALSQYEALKNQVNPHFLFNSLNALTSLVHPKPDLAVKFIKQLSEVYRYVLDSQHKEVVPLEEELHFTQRYVFLQQIRHAEGLRVHFPADVPTGYQVPPLALQMLLENAIKHNRLWAKEPLQVTISVTDQWLSIQNNVQPKPPHEPPSGLGLANIQARYEMLTNRKMEILSETNTFTVRLPLLFFQEHSTLLAT